MKTHETALNSILDLAGASNKQPATTALPTPDVERAVSAARQIGSYGRIPLTLTMLKAPDKDGKRESVTQAFEAKNWQDVSSIAALASAEGGDIFVSPTEIDSKNPSKSPFVYFADVDRKTLLTILKNGERLALENIIETSAGLYSIAFDLGESASKDVREAAHKLVSDKYNIKSQSQQIRVAGFANRDKAVANSQGQAPYCIKLNMNDLNKPKDGSGEGLDSTSTPAPNKDLLIAAGAIVNDKNKADEAERRKTALAAAQKLRSGTHDKESPESLYPIAMKQQAGEAGGDGKLADMLAACVMLAYGFVAKQIKSAIGALSPEAAKADDANAYLDGVLNEATAKRDFESKAKSNEKIKKPERIDDSMSMK